MESTPNPEREESESRPDVAATDGPETVVCRVCRGSIPPTADSDRREALVHRGCEAELRCGVSLAGSGRRHRERASW